MIALPKNNIHFEAYDDDDKLFDRLVDNLMAGKVIGWFQGRFEWGTESLEQSQHFGRPTAGGYEAYRQ